MVRLTPDPDDDLPGNLYARTGSDADDLGNAIMALAFEQRTANLIAMRGLDQSAQTELAFRVAPPDEWDWTLRRYTGKDEWFAETKGTTRVGRGEVTLTTVRGCTFGTLSTTYTKMDSDGNLVPSPTCPSRLPATSTTCW